MEKERKANEMTTLGALLERAREEQGLSQEAAAAALGATPVTYRGWLRGQKPGYGRFAALVKFTGASEVDVIKAIQDIPGLLDRAGDLALSASRERGYLNRPGRKSLTASAA